MVDKLHVLSKVLNMAKEMIYTGESPFAAGIWVNNQIYLAGNRSRTDHNPNMHAEIVCINEFYKQNLHSSMENAIIFTSCEPCLMCFHAIYNAGIRHIVYAATINDAIKYGSGDTPISIKDYKLQMNLDIKIEGPFMRKRACEIFEECVSYRGEL